MKSIIKKLAYISSLNSEKSSCLVLLKAILANFENDGGTQSRSSLNCPAAEFPSSLQIIL